MRSPVIPVLVVIAGLALAWLWWTREPDAPPTFATTGVATANRTQPPSPASSNVPTSASAADAAVKTPAADAPVMPTNPATSAPTPTSPPLAGQPTTTTPPRVGDPSRPLSSRESVATPSNEAQPASDTDAASTSDDDTANTATAAEPATDSPDDGAATTSSTEPSKDAPPPSDAASGGDAAAPSSEASDAAASSDDGAGGDDNDGASANVAEPPKAEPPEAGHAADLVADWMADADSGSDSHEGLAGAQQAFDHEANDPAWAESTKHEIETAFNAWLDTLPDNTRLHIRLLHVECRLSYCQLLGVQNGDHSETAVNASAAADYFHTQPWWSEQRFVQSSFFGKMDDASGYYLFQLYLRRNTTPGS